MKNLFDEIPVLESGRLILRALTDADADDLDSMIHSEKIYKTVPTFLFEQKYDDTHETISKMYEDIYLNKESLILGVFLNDTDMFCGLAEFYSYNPDVHKVSLGIRLIEEVWNSGVATEVAKLMINYLFDETDVVTISVTIMVVNRGSERVAEKLGFTLVSGNVPEDWGFDEPVIEDAWVLRKEDCNPELLKI